MNPSQPNLEERLRALHDESYGWALSCTDWDEAEAQDVLQVAYIRVVTGKARFEGRSGFRTWLFGVIRLVALEHRRKAVRHQRLTLEAGSQMVTTVVDDPTERIERSQSSAVLMDALRQLPDRQREVLHLVFYEGMSIADASVAMGVSVGSARTHYARGKDRMRALIEASGVSTETRNGV